MTLRARISSWLLGMASIIYLVSSAAYLSNVYPSLTGFKRSSAAIFVQIFVATGFYLALR